MLKSIDYSFVIEYDYINKGDTGHYLHTTDYFFHFNTSRRVFVYPFFLNPNLDSNLAPLHQKNNCFFNKVFKMASVNLKNLNRFRNGTWIVIGLVGTVLGALFPIVVYPIMHIDEYSKLFNCFDCDNLLIYDLHSFCFLQEEIQKKNREGINQESIQPGNMRVWSDPFAPREDK